MVGHSCQFPFTYDGVTYNGCTPVDHHDNWCSTSVDENGNHKYGKWGNCEAMCQMRKQNIMLDNEIFMFITLKIF